MTPDKPRKRLPTWLAIVTAVVAFIIGEALHLPDAITCLMAFPVGIVIAALYEAIMEWKDK